MSFKTLLVQVESDPEPDPRLALAVGLANHFGAKLIGVGANLVRTIHYGGFTPEVPSGPAAVEAETASLEAELTSVEEKFRSAAAIVHQGSEWRPAVGFTLTEIAAEARAADLIVTSRSSHRGGSRSSLAAPGPLTLQAGRPVLVAPPNAGQLNLDSVVVAWKDTREARRAISDALPFLQGARRVELVEICDSKDAISAAAARLANVADYLLRHGVKATVKVDLVKKDTAPAQQLLGVARQQKADIIVAGGYGHGRLQEWVFGGFTQALLDQTTLAVMLSH